MHKPCREGKKQKKGIRNNAEREKCAESAKALQRVARPWQKARKGQQKEGLEKKVVA